MVDSDTEKHLSGSGPSSLLRVFNCKEVGGGVTKRYAVGVASQVLPLKKKGGGGQV